MKEQKLYVKQYSVYDVRWGLMTDDVWRYGDRPKNVLYLLGYENVRRVRNGPLIVENSHTHKRYCYEAEYIPRKELP